MENTSIRQNQTGEMPSESEGAQIVRSHSFTRKNRGRRNEILDDEAKKLDDEFWQNNPFFSGEQREVKPDVPNSSEQQSGNESMNENDQAHRDDDHHGIDEEKDGNDQEGEIDGEENEEEEGDDEDDDDDDDDDEDDYDVNIASDEMMSISDYEGID